MKPKNLNGSSHNVKWFKLSRFYIFLDIVLIETERFSTNPISTAGA